MNNVTPNPPDVVAEVRELFERDEIALETLGRKVVAAHVSKVGGRSQPLILSTVTSATPTLAIDPSRPFSSSFFRRRDAFDG